MRCNYRSQKFRHRGAIAPTLCLITSLIACGQVGDRPKAKLPPMPDEPIQTAGDRSYLANTTAQAEFASVFPSHLKRVCRGEPVAGAASYQNATQTPHPTYLVYREKPDDGYLDQSGLNLLPASWEKAWGALSEIELVLCVTKVQQQPVRKCAFKETGQPTYSLEMYNTIYDAELREAKTGQLVAYQEMSVAADSTCPKMHNFIQGETQDTLDADYTEAIYAFAKPHVQPEGQAAE